jgi:hypothetical protein
MSLEAEIIQKQNQLNNFAEDWGRSVAQKAKSRIAAQTSDKATGNLQKSLSSKTKKQHGEIERITFQLPRYGVFFHKGVGRGRGINSGNTKPKPFLNESIESELPKLQTFISENYQDRIINHTRALIQ